MKIWSKRIERVYINIKNQSDPPEIVGYFKNFVLKNIEKRQEESRKNKIFIEKLIILAKKIKKLKVLMF